MVRRVYVDEVMKQYIVALINTTRGGGPRPLPNFNAHVRVGSSPRGGIALMRVAQALALQAGRAYVIHDAVKALRHAVLLHRHVLTYDARSSNVAPDARIDAVCAAAPTPHRCAPIPLPAGPGTGPPRPAHRPVRYRAARGAPPVDLLRQRARLRRHDPS